MGVKRMASKVRVPRKQLDWTPYDYILPAVAARLRSGDYPPPEVLAEIVAFNKDRLPAWLIEHVCAELRGEVKHKRGRRPQSEGQRRMVELAQWDYRRVLNWLQRRKKSQGLKGWKALQGQPWWEGSPHERALAIVHEQWRRTTSDFSAMDLPRFRNLISSGK